MTGFTCIHGPPSSFTTFSKKTVMRIKEVKDLLSLRFQKETDIMHPERHRERERERERASKKKNHSPDQIGPQHPKSKRKKCAAKNKIMHQTKLDYSTQNPRTKRKCMANYKSQ
jgi:hypothetical protein